MEGQYGIVRKMYFDTLGNVTRDSNITDGHGISPYRTAYQLKAHYELWAPQANMYGYLHLKHPKSDTILLFLNGQIRKCYERQIRSHGVFHDSRGTLDRPYFYSDTVYKFTEFVYDRFGVLLQFMYYNSSGSEDNRPKAQEFTRDYKGQLKELRSYGRHTIAFESGSVTRPESAVFRAAWAGYDTSPYFVPQIYLQIIPDHYYFKDEYEYDSLGRMSSYRGYHHRQLVGGLQQSSSAVWEYQEDGKVERQYHHKGKLKAVLEYDSWGNVVEEVVYWGGERVEFTYHIQYYL